MTVRLTREEMADLAKLWFHQIVVAAGEEGIAKEDAIREVTQRWRGWVTSGDVTIEGR